MPDEEWQRLWGVLWGGSTPAQRVRIWEQAGQWVEAQIKAAKDHVLLMHGDNPGPYERLRWLMHTVTVRSDTRDQVRRELLKEPGLSP